MPRRHSTALRLVIERLIPPTKERRINLTPPGSMSPMLRSARDTSPQIRLAD